jgi:hypothetical protein
MGVLRLRGSVQTMTGTTNGSAAIVQIAFMPVVLGCGSSFVAKA